MKSVISSAVLVAMGPLIAGSQRGELRSLHEAPPVVGTKESTAMAVAADTGDRLVEAWVGKLSMGMMPPVMQFRIVVRPDGDTVAYFDSVTDGRHDAAVDPRGDRRLDRRAHHADPLRRR